jgi:hypothetical protein
VPRSQTPPIISKTEEKNGYVLVNTPPSNVVRWIGRAVLIFGCPIRLQRCPGKYYTRPDCTGAFFLVSFLGNCVSNNNNNDDDNDESFITKSMQALGSIPGQ